jgi:hypothetical protein
MSVGRIVEACNEEIRTVCDLDPVLGYALTKRLLEILTHRLDATRMKLAQSP